MAATRLPFPSVTGTAIERRPISNSSSTIAYPLFRTAAIAFLNSTFDVIDLAVWAFRGLRSKLTKSLARFQAPEVRVNAVWLQPIDRGWLRQKDDWPNPGRRWRTNNVSDCRANDRS